MDDIYDNLENYEDVNKIDEIKFENKELKNKIEEYTSTIDKLQRDFDNLAAEHRKLELNYSSLLKTARAEIERKTQMIKDLNIEKDKLVINARQNMIKENRNKYKRVETQKTKNSKSSDSSVQEQHDVKAYSKNDNAPSAHSFVNGKNDTNVTIDSGRNILNKSNIQGPKNCTPKENVMQVVNEPTPNRNNVTQLKKISDRRKSMPALSSNEIKFSSDEENENTIELQISKNNYQPKEAIVNRFADRNYNGNKMSETSSVENYSRHRESFTENYNKNKTNRNRSRDKYESSYRNREKYSPGRNYQGGVYNYYGDDYYMRYDYNSRRAYENPPCEKSFHNSRSRDRRSNYGWDRSRDCLRNRNDDERYVDKHKLSDIDEPSYKRQKFEHGYRYTQYPNYNRWQREQDYNKRTHHSPLELREQLSCQSPDHVYTDYFVPTDPIKEIKYTSNVPLEDPRLSSDKYKTVSYGDKEFLTIVDGRNVDILPANKSEWGFVTVPMPQALLEPPQSYPDNSIKNVSLDNRNTPLYNLRKKSPPSHKIFNKSNDYQKNNKILVENNSVIKCSQKSAIDSEVFTENYLCKNANLNGQTMMDNSTNNGSVASLETKCKNTKMEEIIRPRLDQNVKDSVCNNLNIHVVKKNMSTPKEILKESSKSNLIQELNSMPKLNLNPESSKNESNVDKEIITNVCSVASLETKCKITKTEEIIEAHIDKIAKEIVVNNSNMDMANETVRTSKDILKESSKNIFTQELNSMPQLNLNPASINKENGIDKEVTQKNDVKNNKKGNMGYENNDMGDLLTKIVEEDLILSDETSDAFETNEKSIKKDTKAKSKKKKELKSCNKKESKVSKAEDFADKKKQRDLIDKETSPEQSKTHNNKNKLLENKGSDSDQTKAGRTKRNKKEKDTKTQEIKSKFSDLFGDSSSLITPDDLGIVTHENVISNKYDTIFEDTQAAVDLNLKEIENSQTTKICCSKVQNGSINEKICVKINLSEAVPDCGRINDNNYEKDEQQSNKEIIDHNKITEAKLSVLKETLNLPNIEGNINTESSDVVKTLIVSTGVQPQNILEDNEDLTHPKNLVTSIENPIKNVALHALATSTPAKSYTDITATEPVFSKTQDCLSNTSFANSKVFSTPMDQSSGTHNDSQRSEDMPDVRIFVKRRRKVKK